MVEEEEEGEEGEREREREGESDRSLDQNATRMGVVDYTEERRKGVGGN